MGAPSSRCGQESRAVDKGFLLDVTLSDPLQGLPPMNPMVAIATWTTCGPGRGGAGAVGLWEQLFGGGRWRFFPLALPLTLPLARLVWKCRRQPASHTPYSAKYSSQTAAKQRRPSACGLPSLPPLPSLPSQSSVMWLARLPPLSNGHPPAWASLPGCRKTTEQLPCDTDHWLRGCAAWRITRGSRCGLVRSPFYPGPGLGVSISQRGVFDMAHGSRWVRGRVLPKLRTKTLPLPLPLWKVAGEVKTFLDGFSSSGAPGRCFEKARGITILENRPK